MRIQITNENLSPLLQKVLGVVEKRSTMPILGHVSVVTDGHAINVTATDLEIEIEVSGDARNASEIDVVLPARKLADISRALPPNAILDVRVQDKRALITAARSRFTLLTLAGAVFPRMEVPEPTARLRLSTEDMRFLLDKTAFAMAHGDVRYYLNGALLVLQSDQLLAVATDGHRLALTRRAMSTGILDPLQIILPSKTVHEIRRLLAPLDATQLVSLDISDRTFQLSADDLVVRSKIIDGRYPDYDRAIPSEASDIATVPREALREALLRTLVLSTEKYKGVRFSFNRNSLTLQGQNPELEVAEEELEFQYVGQEHVIGFNGAYVLDVLNVITDELIEIAVVDNETSTIWRGQGATEETFVIMPMRL